MRYLLFLHRVFSTLAVTKISVIEYYPCHNTSNILHTYNKYNNPKGCLKYFEWKSNSRGYKMYFVVSSYYNFHQRLLLQKLCVAFPPSFKFLLWCGLVTCDPFRIRIQLCYYCMCLNNTECKKMPKMHFKVLWWYHPCYNDTMFTKYFYKICILVKYLNRVKISIIQSSINHS